MALYQIASWLPVGLAFIGVAPFLAMATGADDAQRARRQAQREEDHEMIRAVLDGDPTAYRGLVERYQGRIYSIIYGMVRNREDARELSQDAFVKAYKNLSRFRFDAAYYTWLTRIAMNVAIDHLRRQKLRRTEQFDEGIASRDADGVISLAHRRNDPGRNLERKQLRERIMAAMDELPDDQKQVVVLREIEGLSYKEIAEIVGIPEGTVMSRLFYARKKLQVALKPGES